MTLICGWLGTGPELGDPQALVERLTSSQKPHVPMRTAVGVRTGGPAAFVAGASAEQDGDLVGVIEGEPRWPGAELSEIARQRGSGFALLAAYRRFGVDLPRHIQGPFAFAVADPAQERVLAAVDRMGMRPLAYASAAGGLVFGTSSEVVSRHPWIGQRVDPQSIFNYVFFHMVPSPGTIFDGVRKLGPAECLRLEAGRLQVGRYWWPRFANGARPDLTELGQEVRSSLRKAVAHYAEQPGVAAFLSGGLDSSTVSGLLARLAPRRVATYTIGFAEQGFDEMRYARIAAQHFATDAREYYVSPGDVAECLPRIAAAYDEPFGNSSAVPTLLCAQRARADGVERLLAGDGGDELFGGNERYARQKVFDFYSRLPPRLRLNVLEPFAARNGTLAWLWPARKLRSYVQQARVPMPERLETWNFMYRAGAAAMFEPAFLARVDARQPLDLLASTYAEAPTESLVDRMLYLDWKITLADNDLRKVGRMCELAGVKVAYPMLDEAVIDASLKLPASQKVRGLNLRAFYKRTFRDFLPSEIIAKTKHGFGLPFGQWVKAYAPLREEIYSSLERLKGREILQPAFVDGLVREFETDPDASYYGPMIWILSMLEHWLALRRL